MSRMTFAPAVIVLALVAAGCGSSGVDEPTAVDRVSAASVAPGELKSSQRDHVLAIERGGETVRLDLSSIERAGTVRYRVNDPWKKKEVEYVGVLVSDLLRAVGAPAKTKVLHFRALDDYQIDIDAADVRRWPVMLATRSDGRRMAVKDGGPTRIVFPYDLVEGIDASHYNDLWIWNIASLELK